MEPITVVWTRLHRTTGAGRELCAQREGPSQRMYICDWSFGPTRWECAAYSCRTAECRTWSSPARTRKQEARRWMPDSRPTSCSIESEVWACPMMRRSKPRRGAPVTYRGHPASAPCTVTSECEALERTFFFCRSMVQKEKERAKSMLESGSSSWNRTQSTGRVCVNALYRSPRRQRRAGPRARTRRDATMLHGERGQVRTEQPR